MNTQDSKRTLLLIGLPALAVGFFGGMYVGSTHPAPSAISRPATTDVVSEDQFAPFWKAWSILDQKYVAAASTTVQDKVWGSIEGLAASYGDPYTVFFPPQQAKAFQDDISGNFEGVGMEMGMKNDQLVVVAPLKGSPAQRAGVKAGDAILKIGDASTADLSVDKAVSLIRGPKGTTVTLTLLRPGVPEPFVAKIVRDTIDIPTIETTARPDGIFLIRLYSFTAQSPDLFRSALRELVISGDHKLVLDLRGNPGGYLEAAWDMASWFLPAGDVVVTEDFGQNEPPQIYRSKGFDVFNKNLQMMILADNGSASAAEILAGALQEHGIAKLVGAKTFGKGSVQELIPITPETSLKVTIARWLTPKGHNLSHDGLVPDYPVQMSDADAKAGKDPILDKAVQLLNSRP
jgi:carboxyl-terminal processing protease